MLNFQERDPDAIVLHAKELLGNVRRQLAAQEEFYRANGLDRTTFLAQLEAKMAPSERAEAAALMREDMIQVEREVAEEMTRIKFMRGGKTKPNRARATV